MAVFAACYNDSPFRWYEILETKEGVPEKTAAEACYVYELFRLFLTAYGPETGAGSPGHDYTPDIAVKHSDTNLLVLKINDFGG